MLDALMLMPLCLDMIPAQSPMQCKCRLAVRVTDEEKRSCGRSSRVSDLPEFFFVMPLKSQETNKASVFFLKWPHCAFVRLFIRMFICSSSFLANHVPETTCTTFRCGYPFVFWIAWTVEISPFLTQVTSEHHISAIQVEFPQVIYGNHQDQRSIPNFKPSTDIYQISDRFEDFILLSPVKAGLHAEWNFTA